MIGRDISGMRLSIAVPSRLLRDAALSLMIAAALIS